MIEHAITELSAFNDRPKTHKNRKKIHKTYVISLTINNERTAEEKWKHIFMTKEQKKTMKNKKIIKNKNETPFF